MLPILLADQGFQAENLTVTAGIKRISHQVAKEEEDLPNRGYKRDVFWDYSCSVPLLWAPRSSVGLNFTLHSRDQSTACGKVNFWPVWVATTGIHLPKKVFLSSGLQLCLLLSCLLFQTQCSSKLSSPNARAFGEEGTIPVLRLTMMAPCLRAGEASWSISEIHELY